MKKNMAEPARRDRLYTKQRNPNVTEDHIHLLIRFRHMEWRFLNFSDSDERTTEEGTPAAGSQEFMTKVVCECNGK